MLKANALFFVIVLSMIIGLICSTILLSGYFNQLFLTKNFNREILDHNADSGINILLTSKEQGSGGWRKVSVSDGQKGTLWLRTQPWGVFEAGGVKARIGEERLERHFLYGYDPATREQYALYMADRGEPLSLCGETFIRGKCYLPDAGVERAYIGGKNFTGDQLINGNRGNASRNLPQLNDETVQHIRKQLRTTSPDGLYKKLPADERQYSRAFEDTLGYITVDGGRLSGKQWEGYMLIKSRNPLIISPSCQLAGVLIFAPAIIFEPGFEGSVQAFASDSITTGRDCRFEYPSALGVIQPESSPGKAKLRLGKGSRLQGAVFMKGNGRGSRPSVLGIGRGARVNGQVYSSAYTDIKGAVHGRLITERFRLRTQASVYENHLLDAKIDYLARSEYYMESNLLSNKGKKGVVQWME